MKIKYLAIVAFAALATACNDSFLEREPYSISDGNYWKSPNDLKLYANNFYNRDDLLSKQNGWGSIGIYGFDADNGSDTQVRYTYNTRMNGENIVPNTSSDWSKDAWEALRDINYFMDHYSSVLATYPESEVNPYVGEALFFRALFYFNKLRKFGDLPWAATTVEMDSPILYEGRLPRNQIVENILADLDRAIAYLPAYTKWDGRVKKEAAMALQARIALYEGTWEKYHANDDFKAATNKSTEFLTKAADVAGKLIEQSNATSYPALDNVGDHFGYWSLFNQLDYSSSKEVLLWRKYAQGVIANNWGRYSANGSGRGLTKNLADSYLMADGTPVTPGYGETSLQALVADRDPRMAQTFQVNDVDHIRWHSTPITYFVAPAFDGWDSEESCPSGYQLYKGHNNSTPEAPGGDSGTQAMIYFRFGETLLIYAEAKAELGSITNDDLDKSINKLRERVGMTAKLTTSVASDPNFEFTNLSPIIQAIRRERKIELACEGFRVDDIMRWAAAGELIVGKEPVGAKKAQWNGYTFAGDPLANATDLSRQATFNDRLNALETDANGYIRIFKQTLNRGAEGYKFNVRRDYLLPLPTNELTMNDKLKQNPGW